MLKINREKLLGCILGGAVGDALGAPIENLYIDQIRRYIAGTRIVNSSIIPTKISVFV